MKAEVIVPKWGMGIDEGVVTKWLKSVGDTVAVGDPLLEIETAKATQEVESPISGIIVELLAPTGATVSVGAHVATIESANG